MTLKSTKFAGQSINVLGKEVSFSPEGVAKSSDEAEELLARSQFIELEKSQPAKKAPAKSTSTSTRKSTAKKAPAKKETPKED